MAQISEKPCLLSGNMRSRVSVAAKKFATGGIRVTGPTSPVPPSEGALLLIKYTPIGGILRLA